MEKYLLLLIAAIIGICGQILLKMGVNQSASQLPEIHSFGALLQAVFIFLKNYQILSAIFLYGLGLFVWLFILTKFELSYVFPLTAIIYVFILLFSWLFLKEDITVLRVAGVLLIAFGIFLVIKS